MKNTMVELNAVLDELDLGDYGEYLNDYREGYICDIIAEIADGETSIYYSDIIKYASEHFGEVADAIDEFGLDGCGRDLYKAAQIAEFSSIERDIYDHLDDCLIMRAAEYILNNLRVETVSGDIWAEVESICARTTSNDRLDSFLDEIAEAVNGAEDDN